MALVHPPSAEQLSAQLGPARAAWDGIIVSLEERFPRLRREWKPSRSGFGRMCLLRHGARTLLYLTPEPGAVTVGLVLGERAARAALDSDLPEDLKSLIRAARPYAEGRGIRFPAAAGDVATVARLVEIKTSAG